VMAYYLDISTRIAIPPIKEIQLATPFSEVRPDYAVFRLNLSAFLRLLPSALIAGGVGSWFAVSMGTHYGQKFKGELYALIGLIYAATFTALLGLLIPLNVLILNKLGLGITDSEIPFSDEITSFGNAPYVFPLGYLATGMERGLWATVSVIVLLMIATRVSGGLKSVKTHFRAVAVSIVLGLISIGFLLFGPIGFHQFLFDRFVQPPADTDLQGTVNEALNPTSQLMLPLVVDGNPAG